MKGPETRTSASCKLAERTRRGLITVTALSLLLGNGTAAWSQPFAILRLTGVSGRLETGVRGERERRRRKNQAASWSSDELEFDERFRIDVSGYSYHPRFLTYRIGIETQAFQRPINRSTQDNPGGGNRLLYGGDWRLSFLEEHPYNFALYGNMIERDVERSFSRTFRLRSRLYGATGHYQRGPIPFAITYQHWTRKQSDIVTGIREEGNDLIARGQYEIGRRSNGMLEYSYRTDEAAQNALRLTRQEVLLSNTSTFSEDNRRRFFGTMRLYEQRNEPTAGGSNQLQFATRQAYLFGNLEWGHTETLSSFYHSDVQLTDTGNQNAAIWNGNVGIRHHLYESLTSELGIYSSVEDASFGYTGEYGGRVTENYIKRLANWGQLSVSVAAYGELQQQQPEAQTGSVFDEAHTLGSTPVNLDRTDIVTSTIVVTNDSGSVFYTDNTDYIVTVRGRITEIQRLTTGSIQDGETVLVDYEFALTTEGDILASGLNQTTSVSIGDFFTVYVRSTNSGQQLLHGAPRSKLESYDRYLVGARNTWWLVTTTVEYEKLRSTSVVYDSIFNTISVSTPAGYRLRGHLAGSYRFQDFKETKETVARTSVVSGLAMRVWQRGLAEINGEYQTERWTGRSDNNDLDAVGAKAQLTWFYRDLEFWLEGRFSRLNQRGEKEDRDRIMMRVTRRF